MSKLFKYSLSMIIFLISLTLNGKQIHQERSIYRNIVVVEEADSRCMRFENRRKRITNQACINLKAPNKIEFEYVKAILAGYAANPSPKRILIIGLGGGVLSNIMHKISPQAEIINVDIDPVVAKLAKQYFEYQEDSLVKTVIKDGRVFVKRALLNKEKFDWVVLDAFNGDYIPEHLMTKEFLSEVKSLLSENGILSANTFSNSTLYDYESVTYQNVFGDLQILQSPSKGNRVIFACNCGQFDIFPSMSKMLQDKLKNYDIDAKALISLISNEVNWNTDTRILTDQYSPANLLKQME